MWTVIYVTAKEETANKIYKKLTSEGFLIKIKQNLAIQQYEILVPEGELDEVEDFLTAILP